MHDRALLLPDDRAAWPAGTTVAVCKAVQLVSAIFGKDVSTFTHVDDVDSVNLGHGFSR